MSASEVFGLYLIGLLLFSAVAFAACVGPSPRPTGVPMTAKTAPKKQSSRAVSRLAHEQAAFGVGWGIAGMDSDAEEPGHVQ